MKRAWLALGGVLPVFLGGCTAQADPPGGTLQDFVQSFLLQAVAAALL